MAADMVLRYPGYVPVGSRWYKEWQTLAIKSTTEKGRTATRIRWIAFGPSTIPYTEEDFKSTESEYWINEHPDQRR